MCPAFSTSHALGVRDFAFASACSHSESALRTIKEHVAVSTLPDALAVPSYRPIGLPWFPCASLSNLLNAPITIAKTRNMLIFNDIYHDSR